MNPSEIYAKTDRGLQELRDRTLNLPATLRGLLIMIDGNRTVADVLDSAKALKLDQRALTALERGGLIAKRFSAAYMAKDAATARALMAFLRSEPALEVLKRKGMDLP